MHQKSECFLGNVLQNRIGKRCAEAGDFLQEAGMSGTFGKFIRIIRQLVASESFFGVNGMDS